MPVKQKHKPTESPEASLNNPMHGRITAMWPAKGNTNEGQEATVQEHLAYCKQPRAWSGDNLKKKGRNQAQVKQETIMKINMMPACPTPTTSRTQRSTDTATYKSVSSRHHRGAGCADNHHEQASSKIRKPHSEHNGACNSLFTTH